MSRKERTPAEVSRYMASLGAKGGKTGGKSKRRGGKSHYRRVAQARWGDKGSAK